MKCNNVKRLLTMTLAVTALLGTMLTAAASDESGNAGSEEETVSVLPDYWENLQSSSANGTVRVAGENVRTTVAGSVIVQKLQGVAVVTPLEEVVANLGLTDSQTPHITVIDTDTKKSHLAMDCVNLAADSLEADVVTTINVLLNAREDGKIVDLCDGSASIVVGLPKNADKCKTYSVVCVQPGGVTTILDDQDESDATVTFDVMAGLGTYAVVAK